MAISDWPKMERPREKFYCLGADALSDAEILAILLQTGCHGKTALDVARHCLQHFGSIHDLLNTSLDELCSFKGIGKNKYILLQTALELSKRYFRQNVQKKQIFSNVTLTKHYLQREFMQQQQEVFACLFLNTSNELLAFEKLFFGTVNAAHIYPRKIIARALHHNASALILAHNHPSGNVQPSEADCELTSILHKNFSLFDIKILDHYILSPFAIFSFSEHGLL